MAIDATRKIVPGHGTLFTADLDATFPADPLTAFTLTGNPPTGWTNLGHTSKQNTAAFTKDGGDPTVLDSWLADGVDVIYASEQYGLTINPIQVDQDSLDLAFGGFFDTDGGYVVPSSNNGTAKQLFLLAVDGTGKLGFYMASTSVKIGDAPSMDTANFFELPLAARILAAPEDMIPANENGVPGIMKIYKTGLVAAAPVINSISPSTGAVGALVLITGSGFTGVTGAGGVKFGATNAGTSGYTFIDDEHISAIVPTGASGSSPVTVTTGVGTSASSPFTVS